jgi:hypothetical protein
MESVNNLILDYCLTNKVAISFANEDQLHRISLLFNKKKEPVFLWKYGGWVSYTKIDRSGYTINGQIGPYPFSQDFIHLSAEEFFTLALPNKSILESIK